MRGLDALGLLLGEAAAERRSIRHQASAAQREDWSGSECVQPVCVDAHSWAERQVIFRSFYPLPSRMSLQVLVSRCMRFGLWAIVAAVLYNSAAYGRMADIHSTCAPGRGRLWQQQSPPSTAVRGFFGYPSVQHGAAKSKSEGSFVSSLLWGILWSPYLLYRGNRTSGDGGGCWWDALRCYARETGSFAVGLAATWYLVFPLLRGGRGGAAGSSGAGGILPGMSSEVVRLHILLDLVLGFGLVGGAAGSYVVACLGGCWIAWLVVWISWLIAVGGMLWWGEASSVWGGFNVFTTAVGLPLAAGVLPFRSSILWICMEN